MYIHYPEPSSEKFLILFNTYTLIIVLLKMEPKYASIR